MVGLTEVLANLAISEDVANVVKLPHRHIALLAGSQKRLKHERLFGF